MYIYIKLPTVAPIIGSGSPIGSARGPVGVSTNIQPSHSRPRPGPMVSRICLDFGPPKVGAVKI